MALSAGYETAQWATFKQWREHGACVHRGEKGTLIVFYKMLDRRSSEAAEDEGEERAGKVLMAKPSWVFNAAQVDGCKAPEQTPRPNAEFDRIEAAEAVIRATAFDIRFGGSRAFYHRLEDYIRVPKANDFTGSPTSSPRDAFYSTIFHEMAHMTGAEHRLNREKGKRFGDKPYAFEEIIADLSAAMSCAELGIASEPRADHAQYIASWLEVLKNDKRAIFIAATAASAGVSGREDEGPGPTEFVDDRVDLAVATAFRNTDRMKIGPPFPP